MGLAIFVPDILFSGNGKVTLTGDTKPSAIEINAEENYFAASVQLSVNYSPVNAALRGITWSIASGGDYASIDGNGKLTINQNASGASVTVRAVSQADGSVFDEKTITVSYVNPVTVLTKVTLRGNPNINTHVSLVDENDTIEMKYRIIDSMNNHVGMLWGTIDEKSSAYIDYFSSIISVFGADRDHSKVISTGKQFMYRAPTTLWTEYTDEFSINSVSRNGESLAKYGISQIGDGFTPSGDIHILHPVYDYSFSGIEIYYFKFKRNGVVTHAFMPAVKDGIYGFYDEDADIFITNTGDSGTITE